jgi:hypothetical protein
MEQSCPIHGVALRTCFKDFHLPLSPIVRVAQNVGRGSTVKFRGSTCEARSSGSKSVELAESNSFVEKWTKFTFYIFFCSINTRTIQAWFSRSAQNGHWEQRSKVENKGSDVHTKCWLKHAAHSMPHWRIYIAPIFVKNQSYHIW